MEDEVVVPVREYGMSWDEILKYNKLITAIAVKYSGDPSLAEDVAQSVRLILHEDKKLDTGKFDPNKKDAAIGNTIRNKTIKVLRSRKIGRWQFDSLDGMLDSGVQVDTTGGIIHRHDLFKGRPVDGKEGEEA